MMVLSEAYQRTVAPSQGPSTNTGEIEMNAQLMREPITHCGTRRSKRQAFTLVELLVVITIIGILVALLIPAVNGAMRNAKNARIAIEISGLANAMESYKLEMGDYPPDFARDAPGDKNQIERHLARKFRYRDKVKDDISAFVADLDPSEALVFWLSGLSADSKQPLTNRKPYSDVLPANVKGAKAFFEFDQARLRDDDGDGWPEYYPKDLEMPYVYLMNENYGVLKNNILLAVPHTILNGLAGVKAYAAEWGNSAGATALQSSDAAGVKRFANEDKFQILCAGQDNAFGCVVIDNENISPTYAEGLGYQEADEDNITSFSEGSTLKAAMP